MWKRYKSFLYSLKVTIGFSTCTSPHTNRETLVKEADSKLYNKKRLKG
ncbi:MAG: hypothetical protein IJU92_08270 [Spirochaetaceae bacterium]|nr:hypothetical protein [Spirochaetaceae bacterium]